jgi:chromosome partitioning protein
MEDGHRVGLVEADPQGTVSKWGRRRGNRDPCIHRVGSGIEMAELLSGLARENFTLAVIDTAATNNNLSSNAISVADLCLIPARPSAADGADRPWRSQEHSADGGASCAWRL